MMVYEWLSNLFSFSDMPMTNGSSTTTTTMLPSTSISTPDYIDTIDASIEEELISTTLTSMNLNNDITPNSFIRDPTILQDYLESHLNRTNEWYHFMDDYAEKNRRDFYMVLLLFITVFMIIVLVLTILIKVLPMTRNSTSKRGN